MIVPYLWTVVITGFIIMFLVRWVDRRDLKRKAALQSPFLIGFEHYYILPAEDHGEINAYINFLEFCARSEVKWEGTFEDYRKMNGG